MSLAEQSGDSIAVIVVTHESAGCLPSLIGALAGQLGSGDELVIVDNASADGTAAVARGLLDRTPVSTRVIEADGNLGFAAGCHIGAEATTAPLLFFLNPDSEPQPECVTRLRGAAAVHSGWGAWQAAVMLPDGRVNSAGGVVHYLGIGWAGECEQPASALPPADCEIAFASGAAMMVRRRVWAELGGLDREYFMYGEDLDLGLRMWLAGYAVGIVPGARVIHEYEFEKGTYKWFWLERNRWRTVLSLYPGALLALLTPALLAAEVGLMVIALREGWLGAKLRAQAAVIGGLTGTVARRRRLSPARRLDAMGLAGHLTASLDSPYLGAARRPWLSLPQAVYWLLVRRALSLLAH